MKFSDSQSRAITEIQNIAKHFGTDRWFIQEEIAGAGYKTLMALVNRGFLTTQHVGHRTYYQLNENYKIG